MRPPKVDNRTAMNPPSANKVPLSVYISRLRRAFLLRVHPDRFRSRSEQVRKQQATLVQVLSDRLGESDFMEFAAHREDRIRPGSSADANRSNYASYPYSIEAKNGQLIQSSIQLNSSPRNILEAMSLSINFPPPPELDAKEYNMHNSAPRNDVHSNRVDDLISNFGIYGSARTASHTIRDRNLMNFLREMKLDDINERKLNRINASAAALVARRAFQFAAIDGTGLGWSSASLAMLLSKLTDLHDEHKSKLQTKSFYPFRLVFSGDEFHKKIDLYSGVILLNPAATPLQWLNTLHAITDESVRELKNNRRALEQNLAIVESFLNVRIKKGYSCEPEDYHKLLEQIALMSLDAEVEEAGNATSLTPQTNNVCLVIESDQACRRARLRKDGNIEAGVGMSIDQMRRSINNFAAQSNEYKQIDSNYREECRHVQQRIMYEFGVQNVARVGALVTYEHLFDCLSHLLCRADSEKEELRSFIRGQTLAIAGRGQPCHLGDDGSIVIPWNVS